MPLCSVIGMGDNSRCREIYSRRFTRVPCNCAVGYVAAPRYPDHFTHAMPYTAPTFRAPAGALVPCDTIHAKPTCGTIKDEDPVPEVHETGLFNYTQCDDTNKKCDLCNLRFRVGDKILRIPNADYDFCNRHEEELSNRLMQGITYELTCHMYDISPNDEIDWDSKTTFHNTTFKLHNGKIFMLGAGIQIQQVKFHGTYYSGVKHFKIILNEVKYLLRFDSTGGDIFVGLVLLSTYDRPWRGISIH